MEHSWMILGFLLFLVASIKLDGELCGITFYVSNLTAWNTCVGYSQSVHWFEITGITTVPELPSLIILPVFIILTLLAVIVYKRRHLA